MNYMQWSAIDTEFNLSEEMCLNKCFQSQTTALLLNTNEKTINASKCGQKMRKNVCCFLQIYNSKYVFPVF